MSDTAAVLARFPRERSALLPALQALQSALGHLDRETLARAALHLRVPASEVWGVVTSYPELRVEPHAPHARVCTGLACRLTGGSELRAAVERHARRDGGIEEADCLFACAVAPVVEVHGGYHGRLRPDDLDHVLRAAREGRGGPPRTAERRGGAPLSRSSGRSAQESLEALVAGARPARESPPAMRLIVQGGTCGRAVGSDRLLAALDGAAAGRRIAGLIVDGACNGMCYAAPVLGVERDGWPRFVLEHVDVDRIGLLLDLLTTDAGDFTAAVPAGVVWADAPWRGLVPASGHPFWCDQERVLLAAAGWLDPGDLGDALVAGAYAALARALDGSQDSVLSEVRAAGLEGRGGAFFPTAAKWEACRRASGEPKYVVLNGEEGEPGIFKDRHLLEADPHRVLEGVLLAAYAVGATRAILYVHGQADLAAARLERAVDAAQDAGLVGDAILGSRFSCRIELRRGAGGFVLGEETALLESIEGRRAQPRTKPPFPVEAGLWGRPTVVNNVETLAAVPAIVARGGAWFARLGAPNAAGTKVFGLSGAVARPGVVEVRGGVTLGRLLDSIAGGATDGRPLLGAVVGGPSGTIVPRALFDVAMVPRERVSPGTGGITALPAGTSVPEVVRTLLDFNARESCGKCTPCREGTPRLLALLDELPTTHDRASVLAQIRELGAAVRLASLCGLGQAAPLALLDALETFPDAFESRR